MLRMQGRGSAHLVETFLSGTPFLNSQLERT
jgi:hypothetical protein